jgi:membrane protein
VRDHTLAYGSVGAVVALALWLYLSAVAVLLGAEVDGEIERTGGLRARAG